MKSARKIENLHRAKQLADNVEQTIKLLNVSFSGDVSGLDALFVTIHGKKYSIARLIEASLAQKKEVANIRKLVADFEEMVANDAVVKTRGNQTLASKEMKCGRFLTRKILNRRKERIRACNEG